VDLITTLTDYRDGNGNRIIYDGPPITSGLSVLFRGKNNTLTVAGGVKIGRLSLTFDCDNGVCEIGSHRKVPTLKATIRVGQDAAVLIGDDVSMTDTCGMSAVEGATIRIGDDVMFASENQLRADDGHPIFDVTTGRRVNPAQDITIGDHVWVGLRAVLLGGATVGSGSVIGLGSIVTGKVPNNCIAVGGPARVVRRNVAWERPHLSLVKPYYKPDGSTVARSRYWNITTDASPGPRRTTWIRRLFGR
jgi:acetyltransferase-like isoleucine patch superfamily enzyme